MGPKLEVDRNNTQNQTSAARYLLEFYGYDSLSYFALHKKKRFFFSSTGKSFLSYLVYKKVALISGDPIGPREDIGLLLKEFKYLIKGAGLTSCFVGICTDTLSEVTSLGYKKIHIGEEAILPLSNYNKSLLKKKVRRAERHVDSLGITSRIYTRDQIPNLYLKQIKKISTDWLKLKGGEERGFSMTLGRVPEKLDKDCEFVIALQGKKVLGYLAFVPTYPSKTLSLDGMRRLTNTPNGLIEFLLLQAFDHYKQKNIAKLSLNFSTFHQQVKLEKGKFHLLFKSLIYRFLSHLYGTDKLYKFNEKFNPQWNSRYIAFEHWKHFLTYLWVIRTAELHPSQIK